MLLVSVASGRHLLGLSIGLWICVEGQDWAMIRLGKGVGLVLQKREEAGAASAFIVAQLGADPGAWGQRRGRERGRRARGEGAARGLGSGG